jgi:uncharacterized repeat protein (TIGR01451 family)/fimbrial isopeptide formation D2 family protein
VLALVVLPAHPASAAGNVSVTITQTTPATQPTGSDFRYTLSVACAVVQGDCLTNGKVVIPLDGVDPSWVTLPSSLPPGVTSATVQGGQIVVLLADVGTAGAALNLGFFVTPPNITTPDGTTWTFVPTVTGDGVSVTGNKVTSTATASPMPVQLTKKAVGDGTFYPGQEVTWKIIVSCPVETTGVEGPIGVRIDDVLPAGLDYVSSVGTGSIQGTYDAATRTVSWQPNDFIFGYSNCGGGTGGPLELTITTKVSAGTPEGTVIRNTAQVTYHRPGGSSQTASASDSVHVIASQLAAGTVSKVAWGPVFTAQGYNGTFPGDWQSSDWESYYALQLKHDGADGAAQWDVVDDLPCTTAPTSGFIYDRDETGLCADPAWNLTRVQLSGDTLPAGWAPRATLTDGTTVALVFDTTGQGSNWLVPASALGKVARFELPRAAGFDGNGYGVIMFGYADAERVTGDVLRNRAQAALYEPDAPTPYAQKQTGNADLLIVGQPQIGMSKQAFRFGSDVTFFLRSEVISGRALTDDLVLTDLWPADLPLPVADGAKVTFSLDDMPVGQGAVSYAATTQVLPNHDGTGQTLLRWRIPASVLNDLSTASGLDVTVTTTLIVTPTVAGRYLNQADAFLGPDSAVDDRCAFGTVQTSDPHDLDGVPGNTFHCQAKATISVPPGPGVAAMLLTKEVKGDQDAAFQPSPAIGTISATDGTATYRLTWTNRSNSAVHGAVLYDLLPRVGDTGIVAATSGSPRGSTFRPTLASVGALPPGVSVEYSIAANPCRDEVFPDAANVGCVDDWTATAPADLTTVTALRFVSSASYAADTGLQLSVAMNAPPVERSDIAWNTVAASAVDGSGVALLPVEAPKVGITRPGSRHLSVAKVVDLARAPVGDELTYTVSVVNDGALPVADVVATDALPAGVTFVSATGGGTAADGTVRWSVGDLAPGAEVRYTVVVKVAPGTEGSVLRNQFTAAGKGPDGSKVPVDATPETACAQGSDTACAETVVPVDSGSGPTDPPTDPPTDVPVAVTVPHGGGGAHGAQTGLPATGAPRVLGLVVAALVLVGGGAALVSRSGSRRHRGNRRA